MSGAGAPAGFYGKLPAHGDFVRRALPDSFVEPWDAWLQQGMATAREALGDAFAEAWHVAPTWRFLLPPGACGPDAAAGVLLPSADLVGRRFPLALAVLLYPTQPPPPDAFYDALEQAGQAAQDADALLASLAFAAAAAPCPAPIGETPGWWRMEEGAARRWDLPALPPAAQFRVLVEGGA